MIHCDSVHFIIVLLFIKIACYRFLCLSGVLCLYSSTILWFCCTFPFSKLADLSTSRLLDKDFFAMVDGLAVNIYLGFARHKQSAKFHILCWIRVSSIPGGGALDLKTTIRSAKNLASKIRPLQCSEFPWNIPLLNFPRKCGIFPLKFNNFAP